MLIIFDLDDTLIDTSRTITPIKLRMALEEMICKGLKVKNFSKAFSQIKALDQTCLSSKETLKKFLDLARADPSFLKIGLKKLSDLDFPENFKIDTLSKVVETLFQLKQTHQLALVTKGRKKLQFFKLEKAGIEPSIFCKIVAGEEIKKKFCYEALLKEFHYKPENVIVCGDRVNIDLVPAKMLGMTTVHIKRGRGSKDSFCREFVDYSISEIPEIISIM